MTDPATIGIYDARASDYAARNDDRTARDPHLAGFIAALPAGGRVLDLGCGPGAAAAAMAAAGLAVDAVDASAKMVALAAARPGVAARQARFEDIDATARYHGVWAAFSLLHAPRADLPGHLARLHRALRPGGRLHLAMKLGTGEARDRLGRFYAYYSEDALRGHLRAAGFTVTATWFDRGEGLDGTMADFIRLDADA